MALFRSSTAMNRTFIFLPPVAAVAGSAARASASGASNGMMRLMRERLLSAKAIANWENGLRFMHPCSGRELGILLLVTLRIMNLVAVEPSRGQGARVPMANEAQAPAAEHHNGDLGRHAHLLYHFCRLQLPVVVLAPTRCEHHLQRTYEVYRAKAQAEPSWTTYLENLHPLDWYVASACLEGDSRAWEYLFSARAGRSDCLLVDALRARAARLYPRDDERQDSAVTEFCGR